MEFDRFFEQLLEESKFLYEQSHKVSDDEHRDIFLHSSLLTVISALEACIYSIAEELLIEPYKDNYSLLEQSMLLEREIIFEKGKYKLGNNLKMTRITERLELLFVKFLKEKWDPTVSWFSQLKQSIKLRNEIVHPKAIISITTHQVEIAIKAVLETINELYKAIYKKALPTYSLGSASKL